LSYNQTHMQMQSTNTLSLKNLSRITNLHVENTLHEYNWVIHLMKIENESQIKERFHLISERCGHLKILPM